MSCNCGESAHTGLGTIRAGDLCSDDIAITRAAVCRCCRHRKKDRTCGRTGRSIPEMVPVLVNGCDLGRWPDRQGVVTWLRMRWYGVPMPLRWWLMLRRLIERPEDLPACGCSVRMKQWSKSVSPAAS